MRNVASVALVAVCLIAWLTITPAPAQAGKASMNARERAVVRSINRQRAHHGLRHVRPSAVLARAADYHSWEMLDANYFAHESRDGGPFDHGCGASPGGARWARRWRWSAAAAAAAWRGASCACG